MTMKINKLDDGIWDLENEIANYEDEIRDLLQQEKEENEREQEDHKSHLQ